MDAQSLIPEQSLNGEKPPAGPGWEKEEEKNGRTQSEDGGETSNVCVKDSSRQEAQMKVREMLLWRCGWIESGRCTSE